MPMFCIAFAQITTSDWSISDDCANVVYNLFFLLNNTFSRFDPIRGPKSHQITFEQLAPEDHVFDLRCVC